MANRQHVISVDLRLLTGNFDSSLNYIQGRLNGVFGVVSDNATNSFFGNGGFLSSYLWNQAFNAIQMAGIAAFRAIGNEVKRAISYQDNLISMATSYKGLLNLTTKEAFGLARESNIIFQQRNVGLPTFGNFGTQLRAQYGDDFLSAFYDQNNMKGSLERTADMIGRTTVLLGSISGVTNYQRTSFLSNFLSDDFKKLQRLEVFRNSPQLQRAFNSQVDSIGGEQGFNALTRKDRLLLLENIAAIAVDDDIIKAYKDSLGGVLSRLGQELFGDIGIFSFTRDLIFGLPNTSILNSITFFMKEVFAPDGVFGLIKPALQGIVDTVLIGTKFILDRTSFIFMGLNALARVLQPIAPLIYATSSALTVLAAVGLANTIKSAVQGYLISSGAAMLGGRMGMAAMFGMGGDLVGLKTLGTLGLGKLIAPLGFLTMGLDKLADVGWLAISGGFAKAALGIKTFGMSLWAIVANPAFLTIAGIVGAIALAGYTLWKYWEPIGDFLQGFWIGFKAGLPILDQIESVLQSIGQALSPITEGFKNMASAMQPVLDGFTKFFNLQQEKGGENYVKQGVNFGDAASGVTRTILSNPLINPFSGFFGLFGNPAQNKADGDPQSVMSAINDERRKMPSGASLVIANSSENVFTRSQTQQLASAGRGSTVINNTFNISGADPQAIAKQIADIINSQWQGTLTDYA
ncbi:tail protein [Nostoc phage A1]|uniref:Tail protein n=1 Tax=Nostoc phage A1 TaxID=1775256 RepID=A0ACD6B8W3_9CAUD|nr:tail protein [Nostoc phage A1]